MSFGPLCLLSRNKKLGDAAYWVMILWGITIVGYCLCWAIRRQVKSSFRVPSFWKSKRCNVIFLKSVRRINLLKTVPTEYNWAWSVRHQYIAFMYHAIKYKGHNLSDSTIAMWNLPHLLKMDDKRQKPQLVLQTLSSVVVFSPASLWLLSRRSCSDRAHDWGYGRSAHKNDHQWFPATFTGDSYMYYCRVVAWKLKVSVRFYAQIKRVSCSYLEDTHIFPSRKAVYRWFSTTMGKSSAPFVDEDLTVFVQPHKNTQSLFPTLVALGSGRKTINIDTTETLK